MLEIGAGDGFQLELLKNRFERVFAVDPEVTPAAANGFAKCVAEALPFRDGSFDLVISSSVVEHLADRQRAFAEMRRVLRPGAYAAHIVPTRWWKLTSLVFNPLGYPLRVWEKWQAHRKLQNYHSHPPGRDGARVGLSRFYGGGSGHPFMAHSHLIRPSTAPLAATSGKESCLSMVSS